MSRTPLLCIVALVCLGTIVRSAAAQGECTHIEIRGIYGREMFETWYRMAGLVHSALDLDPVITHRLPLADFRQGFEIMASGQSGKIILDWENA